MGMLATGEDQKVKSLVKLQTPVIRISGPRAAQHTVEPPVTIPPKFFVKGEPEEVKVFPPVNFQDHAYVGDFVRRKRAAETVSSESPKRERVETIPSSQNIVLPDDFQSISQQVVGDEGIRRVTTFLDTTSPTAASEYLSAASSETPSPGEFVYSLFIFVSQQQQNIHHHVYTTNKPLKTGLLPTIHHCL